MKIDHSVRSLYHACQAEADKPTSFCKAYLMGVADTFSTFGAGCAQAGLCAATYDPSALERLYLAFAGVQAAGAMAVRLSGHRLQWHERIFARSASEELTSTQCWITRSEPPAKVPFALINRCQIRQLQRYIKWK